MMIRTEKNTFYGSVITMTERKFNIILILMAVVALGLGFFGMPVESIVLAAATIIVSVKMREKYLLKIQTAICTLALVLAVSFLVFLIYTGMKGGYNSYWLMKLIFGYPK